MSSSAPAGKERSRYRAGALLLLYVLAAGSLGRMLAGMQETAEKFGAIAATVLLLVAGCWYAYKDGGRIARVCAFALALVTGISFGAGVVHGVTQGMNHQKAAREVDAQLDHIRAGLAADAAEGDQGPEAARKYRERTQAAASRMKESDDEQTAALGHIMEAMGERTRTVEERLLAALDAVSSDRFMNTSTMLADDDFEWQRDTAKEYGAAAKAVIVVHARLPALLEKDLAGSALSKPAIDAVMTGFNRTWSLSGRVFYAHVKAAKACGALIDFLEKHDAEVEVQEDGGLTFQTDEGAGAYNKLFEQTTAANAEVAAAVKALTEAIAKH